MKSVEVSVAVLQRILDDAAYIKQEDRQALRDAIASKRDDSALPDEVSLKAEDRIEELEAVLSKFVNWTTDESGTKSLIDDVELWELAEKVLESK